MHVFASVTAGSVNPAAIYVVRTIYNPTNNVVLIKYRTQNPHTIYTSIFALHVSYISSTHSPSWRRYTFLSHLTTKSKISVRWIKKLVAATYGVYMFIHKSSLSHS